MPWEKSFEKAEVVEQSMQVFWEKGYAATSISDITHATGVQRSSLYNAFEGKHELFIESLLRYDQSTRRKLLNRLNDSDDPKNAILSFFDWVLKDSQNDSIKRGCFLVNTALDYEQHDEQVQKTVAAAFKEIASFFQTSIQRGQDQGSIPASVNPRSTAKALVALLVGIRVLGRGVFGKNSLQQIAQQANQMLS
ncbi:MAG: TetR/AcrR family transcriptional regulator [Rhodopirellula sp. JB055]|uniref:TetR/AcrR family transcriptional regulator n=1 Tax=Rhodopirellula sp. JB055 TaxID=3342846 RepID=UPI00370C04D4